MNFAKHASFALIMVCLFSMSYLPEIASAQPAGRGYGEECEEAQDHLSNIQDGFKYSKARLIKEK
jgi:hypothetical protein